MNAIIGMSEILLNREIPMEFKDDLLNIKNASEGLLSIINDILDFSKIESGKFEIIDSEYELSTLITEVVQMISIRLLDRAIFLFVEIQPDIPQKLVGDDIRIKQILMNILGNAVKFTNEGYIYFRLWMDQSEADEILLHMSVADSGIGIKKEDMGKLFGMFNQVDTKKNRSISGTGLGLAIVKNLVEMMGGEITVDSIYGKGTTFSWYLKQARVASPAIYARNNNEEWNIVLYEEDSVVAEYILTTLRQFDLKIQHWKEEADFHLVPTGTYCILRKKYLTRYRHMVESLGFDSRIIVILDVMSKKSSFKQNYQQVDMALLGLQLVDIINHREERRRIDKSSYDRNQVIPFPNASVLIVDDNITNLQVAQGLLAPYRMHVDTCMSGTKAILKVQERKYDLIFMDHMMPELDGIETLKMIRNLKTQDPQSLPIVALSANVMGNARENFLAEGFQDFLAKPIEFYQLNRILKTYLRKLDKELLEDVATSKEGPIVEPFNDRIEGIDMDAALRVLGGNQSAYVMILSTYFEDIKTRRRELPNLIEKREYHLITIYVHAIKSASKNVGAEKISQLAYELELNGKEKQYELMFEKMDMFYKQLDQMIENLNHYFDMKIQEQKMKRREWIGELSYDKKYKLQKAAEDMDYVAIEQILLEIKNYTYDTKTSLLLESLQEALGDYDYAQLESIAKKL
jgi:CheY-like chemotaxis protein